MKHIIMPVRKEVWEHRGALVVTPRVLFLVVLLPLILMLLFAQNVSDYQFHFSASTSESGSAVGTQENIREFTYTDRVVGDVAQSEAEGSFLDHVDNAEVSQISQFITAVPYMLIWSVMIMVTISYCLSCLSIDRKDKSILFWKSLPVSEAQSVLTKGFVAAFLIAAISWLTAFVLSVAILLVLLIAAGFSGVDGAVNFVLRHQAIIAVGWSQLGTMLTASLWLLPLLSWLMLASAFSRGATFLTAVLPIVALIIVEFILWRSHGVAKGVFNYLFGILPGLNQSIFLDPGWQHLVTLLKAVQFWLGCLVGAVFIVATVWLRENRFE